MTTSPSRTRSLPSTASASTMPTPAPARSYSSGPMMPGCSAVSPPISAQPAMRQPSAMPPTISAMRCGDDLAAGDVVEHEQRLGAADDEVVDDHADEVLADGVVLVHGLGDRQLGADAVGRGGQQRLGVAAEVDGEEPGEATEVTDHLGPGGPGDLGLHQLDGTVARLDVDAGCGVGAPTFLSLVTGCSSCAEVLGCS